MFCAMNIPATFQCVSSCCCLPLPLKFQVDPGFLCTSCSGPLSISPHRQLGPSCCVPHWRWRHAPGVGVNLPSASYHGTFSLWGLSLEKQLYKCQLLFTVQGRGGKTKELGKAEGVNKTIENVSFPFFVPLFSPCLATTLIWISRPAIKVWEWPSP